MEPSLRRAYNAAFSGALYQDYLSRISEQVHGLPPFRIAETPLFVPHALRDHLDRASREILALLSRPEALARMRAAIPPAFDAPGMDALPSCAQLDFAIVRGPEGQLEGRIVELQGFPSLYAFTLVQARAAFEVLERIPGLDRPFGLWFEELDFERAAALLRSAIVGDEDPETVVLLDLDPPSQKTFCDFVATRALLGVEWECPTRLVKQGRTLLRRREDGRLVPVRRIYNRVVFDELERKRVELPFAFTDELDVSWWPHPNWYWTWSKYSLPHLRHPAVPSARLGGAPVDAAESFRDYVLKPLFSYAGTGVKVEVTRADLDAIPAAARDGWLLQRKIDYARELITPEGYPVAAEMRVMCMRLPGEQALRPVWNLVRLSRGKMLGVDQNRDLDWVGSSVGIWTMDQ